MSSSSISRFKQGLLKNLGEIELLSASFSAAATTYEYFKTPAFTSLSHWAKYAAISQQLYQLILEESKKGFFFALPMIADYFHQIHARKVVDEFRWRHFDFWLTRLSGLSDEESSAVRALIAGKLLPREAYQLFFPIGMGKQFSGPHFVTAHSSPDLDTTVASFWGWLDALTAQVTTGPHHWNVPGGVPSSIVESRLLFDVMFAPHAAKYFATKRSALTVSCFDLIETESMIRVGKEMLVQKIDHNRGEKAVVMVDDDGFFAGDWRVIDVEGVRQVILLLDTTMRDFENRFHHELISQFADKEGSNEKISAFVSRLLATKLSDLTPVKSFSDTDIARLETYLEIVLDISEGIHSTIVSLAEALGRMGVKGFETFVKEIQVFAKENLADVDRHTVFSKIERMISTLDNAITEMNRHVDTLGMSMKVKEKVLGHSPRSISHRADIDEVKAHLSGYTYLTVTRGEGGGKEIPLGILDSSRALGSIIGTASLRDFSNRDETHIPSYLQVISIVDHHKTTIKTDAPIVAILGDVQSANTLLAETTFTLNDKYSRGGMDLVAIQSQIKEVGVASSQKTARILRRLTTRLENHLTHSTYDIHPEREYIEYFHYLLAILDDTDLLNKVSTRDVECVASLLNRLKSITLGKEVEVVDFDDLPRDGNFIQKATARLLKSPDLLSITTKVYHEKLASISANLKASAKGETNAIFADTKTQNGVARVGQIKLYKENYDTFKKVAGDLRSAWLKKSMEVYSQNSDISLHMQMISTVGGPIDTPAPCDHLDEMWLWAPENEQSFARLKHFLSLFSQAPQLKASPMEVEFIGDHSSLYQELFLESFVPSKHTATSTLNGQTVAIIRYKAGLVNSRKAMISPFLPTLT